MTSSNDQLSTEARKIMSSLEGDIFELEGDCAIFYVLMEGIDLPLEHEEKTTALRHLQGNINVSMMGIKDKYYRLFEAMKPNPAMRAVE